jgi:superfamily II DNA/RNA helicase
VFVLYKNEAKELAKMLSGEGFSAWALEGDMSQTARTASMQGFRDATAKGGRSTILVATDVAARGLDVPDVTHVVNFSLGLSADSYVHRIGGCGRAGRKGTAVTFVSDGDERHASELLRVLRQAGQHVPMGLQQMAEGFEHNEGRTQLSVKWSGAKGEVKLMKKKPKEEERKKTRRSHGSKK